MGNFTIYILEEYCQGDWINKGKIIRNLVFIWMKKGMNIFAANVTREIQISWEMIMLKTDIWEIDCRDNKRLWIESSGQEGGDNEPRGP